MTQKGEGAPEKMKKLNAMGQKKMQEKKRRTEWN